MPEYRFREPMSDVELAPSARLVYYWMRTLADKDGHCHARVSELAQRVGFTRAMCSLQITALEDAGYIIRENVRGLGSGRKCFRIVTFLTAFVAAHALDKAPLEPPCSHPHHTDPAMQFPDKKKRRKRSPSYENISDGLDAA